MIDKTKRLEKEQAKAKTKKRIYVEVDPENFDYFPETRQADYYDNDVPQRVAIYVRVSTDDVRQTTSFELQKKYYEDFVIKHPHWTLVKIYADEGISGTSLNKREQFLQMISDAKRGKIDMIITKSVSRFARNTVTTLRTIRELRLMGVDVFFEEQNIDTLKNESELYLVIYAGFAQSESESISKHITWTYRKKFEEGKVSFQYKSFLGYRKGEDKQPEIVPEEAAIVERIYEMFLAGQPVKMIVQTLQAEKIEIPGKNLSFSKNMIMNILRNEKYCGDCILQKTVTVDCISKTRKANQGEAPMYIVENNHPAIISREVFNRAQEELIRRQALRAKSDKTSITATGKHSKYALTEVLQCAECGSRYRRVTWTAHGRKKIVWRCISRLDYGTKHCKDSITVEEAALHGAVVRALRRFHAEDESTYLTLMKATIGEAIGINGGSEEIDLLTRRIDTLNKRMLDLVNETVAAGKDVESSEDEFKGISDQIEQLNRRIAAIQESIHKDGSRQARLEEIQNIIAERNANETQYDDSIVRQMIECIKVHRNGRLTIIFGGGYEIEETL